LNPRKREADLIVESTGTEILLYDLTTNAAHHLDDTAARIWLLCDGDHSAGAIGQEAGLPVDAVEATLERFRDLSIIAVESGHTRRDAFKRSLAGAGAMAALPVIKSIVAPDAAFAAVSGLPSGSACTSPAECFSGICVGAPTGTCA
jgi:hypothetical protein